MTQEQIIEGNILIAEFMGAEKSKIDGNRYYIRFKEPIGEKYAFYPKNLKYRSSWDWLMPVVEKIEKNCYHEVVIFGEHCNINQGETHDMGYSDGETKIEATYKAVVEFIKWHKTQQP